MQTKITIQKVLSILLHRLPLILLSGVLVGLIFFVYTSVAIKPVYSTSAMIYVQNYGKQKSTNANSAEGDATATTEPAKENKGQSESANSNNDIAQKIFNSDLAGSASLATNCVILFQNDNTVTENFGGCNVVLSADSFFITVSVSGTDPQQCYEVSEKVCEACKESFKNRFQYGSVDVIRHGFRPSKPISPDKVKNTLIGVVVGLVLACLISVLLEMIDTTIKGDDDMTAIYQLPVFAEIPDFDSSGR